jgi:single-strand DNA-binding protein
MLNKIMVIGNLGTDPEMRYTPSGSAVTNFRMAVSRSYTASDGERREETEWFTIVAWNQLAEQVNQYLSKGRRAYVEGRLRSRSWEGQDGQTRFVNEINAFTVLFLDRAPQSQESGSQDEPGGQVDPEDLPF